ncbi:MAG TPA: hypothetical protein VHD38_00090 [Candidatus Paceibacterota bacterium]|nr:hypothetical protein [Candidatus Paceibacterota bacterium]
MNDTNLLVLHELEGNPPIELTPLQQRLAPHANEIIYFWIVVWVITGIAALAEVVRQYRASKK